MAEESEEIRKIICQHKQNVRCPENGWIVCRSKKRQGLYYDFNTLTGETFWRDAKVEPHHAAMLDHSGKYDCHEPTEPPPVPACCKHLNVTQSSVTPKIYNKQVINNQFPAKSFPIAPFGNAPCAEYGILNSSNNMTMNAPHTPVWLFPPPSFLGPTIAALNPVQSIYEGLQNIQVQNTSVPLSNRFQVLNQLNNENMPEYELGVKKTHHTASRNNPNFVKTSPNKTNDLRSLLSDRRRQGRQNNLEVSDCPEASSGFSRDISTNETQGDEINPDDTDEWLETHTDNEGKKLKMDLQCIWELADSSASRDCWYILTSSKVLLNNIRFFSTLVSSDDRLRLLAPQDVVRRLRSATFTARGHFAECAKRLLLTIRQNKLPNTLKDASIVQVCFELIGQNKHVVLITDENDLLDQNTSSIQKFTVNELKQFLTINSNQNDQTEKLKRSVQNTQVQPEHLSTVITTPSLTPQEVPKNSTENRLKENETTTGPNETETETSAASGKQTANAYVQTDFVFPITQFAEHNIKTITPEQATKISSAVDIGGNPNDSTASKAAPRKIKLRRQIQSSNVATESDEKKSFRWRKRKDACSKPNLTPPVENVHKSYSYASSHSNSTNDFTAQQNDNAVDGGLSDVSVNAKLIEETSTSGVVSNSIDSENMFKINKRAILNESQANKNEEIVMYEVTSEFMNDRLRTRFDEWVPRFFQIMEEVLSVVLLMEPAFTNESPWDIQEATLSIKQKYKGHSIIVSAADKLAAFLYKINDDKGNIKQNINSKEFMEMFSYGVNLIKVLQLELPNCEDLKISTKSLFELLSDIQEPSLDETDETFNGNNLNISANVSGSNLSTAVPDNTVPADKGSTRNEEKLMSCNDSRARYSLRSSRINIQKKEQQEKSEAPSSNNTDKYLLFSSLGLKKNTFKVDTSITKTITNVPQQQPVTPIAEPVHRITPDIIQDVKESNEHKTRGPKIVRNFTICPEIEMKLKGANKTHADPIHQEDAQDDHVAGDDFVEEHIDFTQDENIESDNFINENNSTLIQTAMDAEQNCKSTKPGDLDSNDVFRWIVNKTTYEYNSCLVNLRRFCETTHEELKAADVWDPKYKICMLKKTKEVSEQAMNLCHLLKCILNREPSVTKSKFRYLFNMAGIQEDISETQISEYRVIIEKYLKHAAMLHTFVRHLVDLDK